MNKFLHVVGLVEKGGIEKITLRKKNVIFSIQKKINILLQEVKSKHVGVIQFFSRCVIRD